MTSDLEISGDGVEMGRGASDGFRFHIPLSKMVAASAARTAHHVMVFSFIEETGVLTGSVLTERGSVTRSRVLYSNE